MLKNAFRLLGGLGVFRAPNAECSTVGGRSLRLQALTDGLELLASADGGAQPPALRFAATAELLERVTLAAEAADLSSSEQDGLEAKLAESESLSGGVQTGLQRLLALGVPLSKIERTAVSLMGGPAEPKAASPDSLEQGTATALAAVRGSVSAALELAASTESSTAGQPEIADLHAVVRSLEDGSAAAARAARDLVWDRLQEFVLRQPGNSSGQAVVELLTSLPAREGGTSR